MDTFVDREREFEVAMAQVQSACAGRGGFLVIDGSAGIGKSALLAKLAESGGAPTFLSVRCHAQVGHLAAYGPLVDLAWLIEQSTPRHRRLLRRSGEGMKTRWPELLTMVPGVGEALKMVAESLSGPVPGAPLVDHRTAARSMAEATLALLRAKHPAVVMIDDVHRIDGSSCAALSYLARAVQSEPVLFVLALRHDETPDNPAAQQLIDDLQLQGARQVRLGGLPPAAVEQLGRLLAGSTSAQVTRRLVDQTGGHPLLLHYCLGRGRPLAALPAADDVAGEVGLRAEDDADALLTRVRLVIQARLRRLSSEDLRLLSIAAVQGRSFHSSVVAHIAGQDHDVVAHRLHRLATETGMLYPVGADDWDDVLNADRYSFEHDLLQETLYRDQTERQRRERHRKVGRILYQHSRNFADLNQELALDLIRHHRLGGDWLSAAKVAHDTACRLAGTGASTREVIAIAEQGLHDVRHAAPVPDADRLRAQLIELLLTASELSWRTRPEADGTVRLEALSAEALEAARTANDEALQVRVRYLHGKVLLYTRGVPAAIGPLQEAWETALDSGDSKNILLAGCEYGRQLPKVNVEAGLDVLRRTEEAADALADDGDDPVLQRARHMTALQLGVSLLDAGRLGPALTRLRAAVPDVRRRPALGLLPIGLNYLAQGETAVGNYAEAERLLTEATALHDADEPDGWHAVNLAYLGSRRALDQHDSGGLALLEQARDEAEATWQANLAPLVANLYAASLIALATNSPAMMRKALSVLNETLTETRRTGMRRSEIAALSLLGEWHRLEDLLPQAMAFSELAVDHIRTADWKIPAVCVEEVLYRHSRIQEALGDEQGARESVIRAASEVNRKADSLDGDARVRFLRDVPLNRAILAAAA
ncbi:AAA family ATPase [Verrucosispora sp. WMMA2121]|uniref:ATP-binding protein n=1 Tax=Verrucosispora sp. WMMA2121 TaxID=3015164 RepID=UPI0022B685F7|nr:AAA family ATPase [Verrucosispora sp. WMMA2121]MCZ7420698.1 AAA family ATPase [Verrucosispora sp. WMMA2121]